MILMWFKKLLAQVDEAIANQQYKKAKNIQGRADAAAQEIYHRICDYAEIMRF